VSPVPAPESPRHEVLHASLGVSHVHWLDGFGHRAYARPGRCLSRFEHKEDRVPGIKGADAAVMVRRERQTRQAIETSLACFLRKKTWLDGPEDDVRAILNACLAFLSASPTQLVLANLKTCGKRWSPRTSRPPRRSA
jgi:hypothetical protein